MTSRNLRSKERVKNDVKEYEYHEKQGKGACEYVQKGITSTREVVLLPIAPLPFECRKTFCDVTEGKQTDTTVFIRTRTCLWRRRKIGTGTSLYQ